MVILLLLAGWNAQTIASNTAGDRIVFASGRPYLPGEDTRRSRVYESGGVDLRLRAQSSLSNCPNTIFVIAGLSYDYSRSDDALTFVEYGCFQLRISSLRQYLRISGNPWIPDGMPAELAWSRTGSYAAWWDSTTIRLIDMATGASRDLPAQVDRAPGPGLATLVTERRVAGTQALSIHGQALLQVSRLQIEQIGGYVSRIEPQGIVFWSGERLFDLNLPASARECAIDPDGRWAVCADGGRAVWLDLATGESRLLAEGDFTGLRISDNGERLLMRRATRGPTLLLSLPSGSLLRELPAASEAALSGNGAFAFLSLSDGIYRVDLTTGGQTLWVPAP